MVRRGRKMTAGIPASSKTVLQICHLNEIVSWPKKAGTFRASVNIEKLRDGWIKENRGFRGKIDDRVSFVWLEEERSLVAKRSNIAAYVAPFDTNLRCGFPRMNISLRIIYNCWYESLESSRNWEENSI